VPAYDTTFNPPAPVADAMVAHPIHGARRHTLRGILDCGAAITVIPERLVTQLALSPRGHAWTRTFDGKFYVRLRVEGFDVPIVRCVAADRTTVLVGRNVLNRFLLVLNGKHLTFDLQDP
jgi:hypothetical protein